MGITLNCVIEGPEIDFVPSGSYCNTWSGWLNMLPIEFKPSLSECIETLESTDFRQLRAECEKRLSEGKGARLILRLVNGEPETKLIVK